MTSYYPPTTNFPNINFNNDFFAIPNNNQGITLAYANTHYLFSTGVANSSAISTFFTGGVGLGVASGTAGSLNAITVNGNELQIKNVNVSNIFITSNVLSNVLSPYDTITARTTAVATKQDILTSSTALLGNGSAITNLNYSNISNAPIIANSQWTTTASNLYYNSGNVGIGTIAPSYKLEVLGTTKTNELIINNVNFNNIIYNTSNSINNNLISTSNGLISVIDNKLLSTSNALISVINTTSNAINNNVEVVKSTQSNLNNNFILYTQIFENSYCKKSTFLIETNNLLNYNSVNYYTYTIDLTKYLKYLQISDITKLLRFRINATLASSVAVFSYLTECEYKIMMSQSSSIGQTGGFHCRCFGIPEDLNLTKFAPYKFIKNNNIYQLTYISPVAGAKFLITIIDEL